METFFDFIDYCISKKLLNEDKKQYIHISGIVTAAINYVKSFVPSVKLDLYDEDDRYTAINHIYAAGAYTADQLNSGADLETITQLLAVEDALMLIMVNSRINRDSIDSMSTCLEMMATDWVNNVSDNAEIPLRLSNMLVGTFLLGVMTFAKESVV